MTTAETVAAVLPDLYRDGTFTQPRGRGKARTTRLVHRRTGRVLAEGSGNRTREELLRTLRLLTPVARDLEYEEEYEAWSEQLDATLPPVTSQGAVAEHPRCPKCGAVMTGGAPHGPWPIQYECQRCGVYLPG